MNDPLSRAYLETRPEAAARVLEGMEASDAAALVAMQPAKVGAGCVREMYPLNAAWLIEQLSPDTAAALIRAVPYQDSVGILRLVSPAARDLLLAELPGAFARAVDSSLRYPKTTVGAWMDHRLAVFRPDHQVRDVLRQLRRQRGEPQTHVFVVGAGRRLAGSVALDALIRAPEDALLETIMVGPEARPLPAISNRASLGSVRPLAAWDEYRTLPVVGRRGNVLGGLSRMSLRRGISDGSTADSGRRPMLLSEVLRTYLFCVTALVRVLLRGASS